MQPFITDIIEDEEHCQQCGGSYSSDNDTEQQECIGCGNCWRWFHYGCVGLMEIPEEKEECKCPECL